MSLTSISRESIVSARLKVTIEAKPGRMFRGFLLEVRDLNTDEILGRFSSFTRKNSKLLDCLGGRGNAVTHKSPAPKNRVHAIWAYDKGGKFCSLVASLVIVVNVCFLF